ncbi:MAG: DUF4435 domain-containing protein [Dolichospermum sp. UKL201]|jgi:hypothetical protein|nr:MAG: DUF4435 domain-containing protein [Dolichospermum sp. UKL201]
MMRDQDYQMIAESMIQDAWVRGCEISVLVEDIYDQRFWECIIENVKPDLKDKIDFPNPTPEGTRGKSILKKFKNCVSEKIIICIDSDCEYLYDPNVWYIAEYIYHTVVYSKENFQCHHLSLHQIPKDLTTKRYDFKSLLEKISRRISPIFYFWFYFKENNFKDFDNLINNEKFATILSFEGTQFETLGDENLLYQSVEDRVKAELQNLKILMGEGWYDATFENDIPEIRERLKEKSSIQEEKILDFYYGHSVLEEFVQPFMVQIIEILKNRKIEEVRQTLSAAPEKVINETISRIENIARKDIDTKLSDSFKYLIDHNIDQNMEKIKEKLAKELN